MATWPRQIAGSGAAVTSILSNPDQDPHLFEASPSVARAFAGARIVVLNGADYDPWMGKLLRAAPRAGPAGHRGRRIAAREAGRQPASLVRPADHAGVCAGAGRRTCAISTRRTRRGTSNG